MWKDFVHKSVVEAGYGAYQTACADLTFTNFHYRALIPLLQNPDYPECLHVWHQMLAHHCIFDIIFSVFSVAAVNSRLIHVFQ